MTLDTYYKHIFRLYTYREILGQVVNVYTVKKYKTSLTYNKTQAAVFARILPYKYIIILATTDACILL